MSQNEVVKAFADFFSDAEPRSGAESTGSKYLSVSQDEETKLKSSGLTRPLGMRKPMPFPLLFSLSS